MNFKNYLEKNQPILYKTFASCLESNRLSHAYLIKGNEGAPLLETSLFLAKTLICPHSNPFACENCINCIRFDEGNYADFKLLNGQERNIKVGDIEELQTFFQKTPTEKSGKMIYIIHLLENSNKETLNALLKFLEEPQKDVYAFITTYNEEKILPTILSRMQHLKLLPIKHNDLIKNAQNEGISLDDCEILSSICGSLESIINTSKDNQYLLIKDLVFDTFDNLFQSKNQALFFVQNKVIPELKDKVSVRLFLDIFIVFLRNSLDYKIGLPINLTEHKETIVNICNVINNLEDIYKEFLLSRGQIELNINLGLLLEHIFIYLMKRS